LYALGLAISQSLGTFSLSEAELDMVKNGLTDGVLKRSPKADLQTFGPKIQQLQQARLALVADGEKKAGAAFLTKAASEKGSTKTESGIVITTIKPGTGATPKATDTVKVHYHGTLTDGTVFDSSVKRGEPATFPLDKVIKCWTEGVQQIKAGGKSRLICPSNLAYGDAGSPPVIKPGSTLVFEVELLEIVNK
jgi:FKBP-type peptidyl-prolyl cis-trans isomerase FkpA